MERVIGLKWGTNFPDFGRAGPSYAPTSDFTSNVACALVFFAVVFNACLAALNAHVTQLGAAPVIGVEAAIVAAAQFVALRHFKGQMASWYLLIAGVMLIAVLRNLAMETIEAKYLRDIILVPTFVTLGMTCGERSLTQLIVLLHATVLTVMLLEAFDTSAYSDLFKVENYYIDTRGFASQDFWNDQSDLFLSATRPNDRFFGFVDLHRLSSIFLEPVSLGNYCIIVVAFVCARFKSLGRTTSAFLILGTFAILVGCDSRLGAVTSAIIVLIALISHHLPRGSAALYIPSVTVAAFIVVSLGSLRSGPDDFSGRLALTVELLDHYDLREMLGASDTYLAKAYDSGLAYLITTQSIFGVALLWLCISFAPAEATREQVRFKHAVGVYIAFSMMVSNSFLSIKTAALLWFILGALQNGISAAAHDRNMAGGN